MIYDDGMLKDLQTGTGGNGCKDPRIGELAALLLEQRGIARTLGFQVSAMQEVVEAAMNENIPRLRAATKAYQDLKREPRSSMI